MSAVEKYFTNAYILDSNEIFNRKYGCNYSFVKKNVEKSHNWI